MILHDILAQSVVGVGREVEGGVQYCKQTGRQ